MPKRPQLTVGQRAELIETGDPVLVVAVNCSKATIRCLDWSEREVWLRDLAAMPNVKREMRDRRNLRLDAWAYHNEDGC